MRTVFAQASRRYGTPLLCRSGETEETIWGFLQPMDDKTNRQTPCGTVSLRQWLLLSSAPVQVGDSIQADDAHWRVQLAEAVQVGDTTVCHRAILRREESAWNGA